MKRRQYTFDVYLWRDSAWHYRKRFHTLGWLRRLLRGERDAGGDARIHIYAYDRHHPLNKGRLIVVQSLKEWLMNDERNGFETALDHDALLRMEQGAIS